MKSHSCLLYNELIKQSFLVYIFKKKELIFSRFWQPYSSLGVGPTPAPIEDCSLDHCGGNMGCLNHGGLRQPASRGNILPGRARTQSWVCMPGRRGLPPNVVTAFPIQASAGPFLGLLYINPSSSPHIMLYILKTNHLCTLDKNSCNKAIAT